MQIPLGYTRIIVDDDVTRLVLLGSPVSHRLYLCCWAPDFLNERLERGPRQFTLSPRNAITRCLSWRYRIGKRSFEMIPGCTSTNHSR